MIDVIIAGAGPNGLMLASELCLAGVRPVVLERLPEPATEQKANGLVGQVVRMLDRRCLYEKLSGGTEPPHPAPGFVFGALPLELSVLDDNPMYTLAVPQRRIEQVLEERAAELGAEIRRGHELSGLSQDADTVTVEVAGPDGYLPPDRQVPRRGGRRAQRDPQAGRHRLSRRDNGRLGLPPGTRDPAGRARRPGDGWADRARLRVHPAVHAPPHRAWAVRVGTIPVPSAAGVHRGAGHGRRGRADDVRGTDRERPAGARGRPAAHPAGGPGPHLLRRLVGGNTRIASRFVDGRVLLLGDAAHVHSAIGGPGLNLGLQDAVNLGWKLAAEIHGWAPAGLLDTYETERRPAAERVVMHTQAQSALVAPGKEVTELRTLFLELLRDKPTVQRIADLMSGADIRYDMGVPTAGHWAPDLVLHTKNGTVRLAELTRDAQPLLLDLTKDGTLGESLAGRVRVVTARADSPITAMLLRPDSYVAWSSTQPRPDPAELDTAMTRWFGPERHNAVPV